MKTGYVLASFDLKNLVAKIPGCDQAVALRVGGLVVPDSGIPVFHAPVTDAPAHVQGKAVMLRVEYDEQDVLPDRASSGDALINLATVDQVSFVDPEDAHKFGNLFDPQEVQTRRDTFRQECLLAGEFPRKYVVLRAMSKEVNHLFPMDYAYLSNGSVLKTMARRVVDAYLEGDRSKLHSSTEKALMLTLDHAATMALSLSEPQHVTVATVDNRHLYKARNAGEFFYDGDKPLKVESLIEVSAEGVPSLANTTPSRQHLLAPTL